MAFTESGGVITQGIGERDNNLSGSGDVVWVTRNYNL